MKRLNLVQGSDEWRSVRGRYPCASEAPIMMGASRHMTRSELLRLKALGLEREFSDYVQGMILAKGHYVEGPARQITERQIGEKLYPITALDDTETYLASLDGCTMAEDWLMEHKQWSEDLAAAIRIGATEFPDGQEWQLEQQLLVASEAEGVIFVCSDGTEERRVQMVYRRVPGRAERLKAGWAQFEQDRAAYVPPAAAEKIVAEPVQALPAVSVQVTGELVLRDNFKAFEQALRDFLEHRLIREPKTDQDFADLDVQIKAMKGAEAALESAEAQMLAQIQTVDQAKKTKDMLAKLVRDNRLMAEKLLTSEKERRKGELVAGAIGALKAHVDGLNARLGKPYMPATATAADFGAAIKGLKTIASMEDKLATALANAKIAANEVANRIQANLTCLRDLATDHAFLFADTAQLVLKAPDDCRAQIEARIAAHKAEQERRAAELAERERARIRAEEEARARAQAQREQQEREAAERRQRQEPEAEHRRNQVEKEALTRSAPELKLSADAPALAANVLPMPTKAPAAAATPPTLRLGQINERLGFTVTADFLASIGFPVVATDKAAKLWHEHQFHGICAAIAQHAVSVANQKAAA